MMIKMIKILHALEIDAKVPWGGKFFFCYGSKATSFFNLLIHPIIVFILLVLRRIERGGVA